MAIKLQQRLSKTHPGMNWQSKDLYLVISGLLKANRTTEALPLISTYIQSFSEHRFAMEVAMMKIWLQQQRPRRALKYMDAMNLAFYTSEQQSRLQSLIDKAKRQVEAGVVELESDDAL